MNKEKNYYCEHVIIVDESSILRVESSLREFKMNDGLFVDIEEIQTDARIKYYPNPIVRVMVIEVTNTEQKPVSVDIYSLTGQRLRNLANQSTDENINLAWNGINEQGQQVPYGMYILKINNVAKQLVFKRR